MIAVREEEAAGLVLIFFFSMVLFPVWSVMYWDSYAKCVKLEAFYTTNYSNYITVEEKTKEVMFSLDKALNLETMQQSTNWSERIKEMRDEVNDYNIILSKLRRYNSTIWLSPLFATPSKDLKLIKFEK